MKLDGEHHTKKGTHRCLLLKQLKKVKMTIKLQPTSMYFKTRFQTTIKQLFQRTIIQKAIFYT